MNKLTVSAVCYDPESKTYEIKDVEFELNDREWVWNNHFGITIGFRKRCRVSVGVDNHGCSYVLLRSLDEVRANNGTILPDAVCNFQAQVEQNRQYTQPLTPNAIAHMKRFLDASFASIDNDVLQRFRDMARIDVLEERLRMLEAKMEQMQD